MPVEQKVNPCSQAADGRPSTRECGEVNRGAGRREAAGVGRASRARGRGRLWHPNRFHHTPPSPRRWTAVTQRSQSSALSPRRDSLPPLPCPESSRHPEDGSAKTGSVEHGEALPRSSSSGAELLPLPSLPPLPAKAATQADASLRMDRGQTAASTSQVKLPPLPASSGCSARGRLQELQRSAEDFADDNTSKTSLLEAALPCSYPGRMLLLSLRQGKRVSPPYLRPGLALPEQHWQHQGHHKATAVGSLFPRSASSLQDTSFSWKPRALLKEQAQVAQPPRSATSPGQATLCCQVCHRLQT
ncbi:uncharacterized protein LOC134145508 [Rhea pennata]|uniref:uncharacterized protein LOC134145508 n=1 Tax=Rhea pennata TaxID=8795 RepID=UPI002E263CF7